MDWTPESFSPSSHQARSLSGNPMVFDVIPPAYPSGHPNYPPVTGLGISHGEVDVPLGQLRPCPPPEVYTTTAATATLPTAGWSDGILPHSVDHSYYSSTTPYEPYSAGHSDISPSPLSLYSAQTLSASSSYSSGMETGSQQPLGFWATTPCSDSTSPPESFAQVKEESDEYWGSPLFAEERAPIEVSMMPMPRVIVNEPFPDPQLFQAGSGQQFGPDVSVKQEDRKAPVTTSPVTNESTAGTGKKTPKTRPKSKRSAKSPSASIHQCTICETRFTRRSNCIEHIKKHNPDTKKAYPCDLCGRTFGRKTDRKRHVESVSLHKPDTKGRLIVANAMNRFIRGFGSSAVINAGLGLRDKILFQGAYEVFSIIMTARVPDSGIDADLIADIKQMAAVGKASSNRQARRFGTFTRGSGLVGML